MNHHTFPKIKINSVGTYLPDNIVKSDDLMREINSEANYDISHDWLSDVMGIEERRVSNANAKPSDIAIPAARQAIESCTGLDPAEIDLVIFCGIERDQPEPATAHTIQKALGLKAKQTFDIANACLGFIDAMDIASTMIKCGNVRHALVVTGEVPSRVLWAAVESLKKGIEIKAARSMLGALSVGDAGGAVIMSASDPYENTGFELFNKESMSTYVDKCRYEQLADGSYAGQMQMGQLAGAFIKYSRSLLTDTLEKLGWDEFDWMLSHQIGKKPFERISCLEGIQENSMIKSFDKLGNITTATFPVCFEKLVKDNQVNSGARIGGCFAGSGISFGQFGYVF